MIPEDSCKIPLMVFLVWTHVCSNRRSGWSLEFVHSTVPCHVVSFQCRIPLQQRFSAAASYDVVVVAVAFAARAILAPAPYASPRGPEKKFRASSEMSKAPKRGPRDMGTCLPACLPASSTQE